MRKPRRANNLQSLAKTVESSLGFHSSHISTTWPKGWARGALSVWEFSSTDFWTASRTEKATICSEWGICFPVSVLGVEVYSWKTIDKEVWRGVWKQSPRVRWMQETSASATLNWSPPIGHLWLSSGMLLRTLSHRKATCVSHFLLPGGPQSPFIL